MTYTFKIIHLFLMSLMSLVVANVRPRVVGGIQDDGQEFPFAAMIQDANPPMVRFCTGSIIARTWVLTAGHCVPNDEDNRRIKYGDMKIPSNETKNFAKIIKGYKHPGYKKIFDVSNDIGLLKTEVMTNPAIGKLYAVDYRALMGLAVKYAGFGRSRLLPVGVGPDMNVEEDVDPPLLVGEAVVISCRQDRGLSSGRPAICVAPRCGPRQHAYYGDSGGPLILNGRIIGVTNGFGTLEVPILGYGPVSPYLNWIYDKVHAD